MWPMTTISRLGFTFLALSALALAQAPTGTISGTVKDPSGAVVPNAKVTVSNRDTGLTRDLISGADGSFSAPALPAGNYEVRCEATGLRTMVQPAVVETGAISTVNLAMQVGATTDVITVEGAAANLNYESNTVQGVVTQEQIANLPLNGRSFLNLAQLEPGVLVTPGNPAQFNAQFQVSVMGSPASHTAITIDGSNIRNPVEGGPGQNFSQEMVQEFQLSSTNFDLSTGITSVGAINIVSRSGGNDFHGAGFFYYRDHNISAYPSLVRNSLDLDPYFARKQTGFSIGGPIKKDKLFFFGNFEYAKQTGVYAFQPDLPSLAVFGAVAPAPYSGKTFGFKIDYHMSAKTTAFLRYSHDGNTNTGPFGTPTAPSNFVSNSNWVDQYLLGVTSILSPKVVNDLRFTYWFWQNRNIPAPCNGCPGEGGPEIYFIGSTNTILGNNFNSPQGRDLRRYPLSDNVTWELGSHRVKFGGEWEHYQGTGYWGFFSPSRVYLLPPEVLGPAAALYGIVGGKVSSYSDLYKLPVVAFEIGVGDRDQPPPYNLDNAKTNERLHFYAQDTWKVRPSFTLNYGLGWEFESNVLNYDESRPALLAPLYGSNLGAPGKQYKNFEPALGFAWNVGKSNKTVIRGGAGIFYDTELLWWRLGERASLGPDGRQFIGNAAVFNPGPSFPGIPTGASFANFAPYFYTFGAYTAQFPYLLAQQNAIYPGTGTAPQILVSKQAGALGALFPQNFPTMQSQHVNIGIQRELSNDLVVQADFVYRHSIHETPGGFFGASVDYNKFYSVQGPIIPACSPAQAFNPAAQCSNGPIDFWYPGGTSAYKALLLKLNKRFAHRYQFTASYAYQNDDSINNIGQNLNNYFATYGPDLPRHNLNMSGVVDLRWGFQFSLISAFVSRPPVQPIINGVDNTGTDTQAGATMVLPGMQFNQFLSQSQLTNLVNQYNTTYAGKPDPAAVAGISPSQIYPKLTLPANYNLGHDFTSQDIRITKSFKIREKYEFRIIGEAFNIFNFGNVTGDSYILNAPEFGLPQQRISYTFGDGGPRAFQFAGRFQF
jgi:hypothetical protein